MMQIHAVPAFDDNYLWVIEDGRNAAVVDPGDEAPVQTFLEAKGLTLTAILVTHHHGDHVGGVEALAAHWRCAVFGPAAERIAGLTTRLREGDHLTVPGLGLPLEVLEVPGHTAGHIAYLGTGAPTESGIGPVVFCGDTLFACGCGRLFEGTPAQMVDSLAKLARLPGGTRMYCAHEYTMSNIRFAQVVEPGNAKLAVRKARDAAARAENRPTLPSTIADELDTNPFLRCTSAEVVASASKHAGRPLATPLEVFTAVREWKNNFR
ncbi:MAG TPA: hydroxyacylglutathione hydrolase [Usitatibacteraceae bacterium]|nr:hydroxyacylglutathione hydrolase [Usitatibacteraceae bacterium]